MTLRTGNKALGVNLCSYFPEFLDGQPRSGWSGSPMTRLNVERRTDLGMTDWASEAGPRKAPCLPRSLFANIVPTECNVHHPTLGKWAGESSGHGHDQDQLETKMGGCSPPQLAWSKLHRCRTDTAPSTVNEPMQLLGKFFQVVLLSPV